MLPLTKDELKSYQDAEAYYICRKTMLKRFSNDKNYQKVRDHCHFKFKFKGTAHSICNLKFNVPNEIHLVFHNGLNYNYHFVIKK